MLLIGSRDDEIGFGQLFHSCDTFPTCTGLRASKGLSALSCRVRRVLGIASYWLGTK